jgi:MFS family permease
MAAIIVIKTTDLNIAQYSHRKERLASVFALSLTQELTRISPMATDLSDDQNNSKSALNPTVIRLGVVSFLADVSSEMLYPITPIFLTMVLGASVMNVGIIEGCAEGTASLLKTYSGRWSDRIQNRKTFVWLGYLFAAIAKPITGAATSWIHVLFARSFDRLGKGIRSSPRDALLAEAVDSKYRGAAFGWHRMMDTAGAAVGPLLAILFLHYFNDPSQLRWIYYLAVIPGLLSVLVVFTLKETKKSGAPTKPAGKFEIGKMNKDFKTYLLAWGVFSLANSSDVFLILKAKQSGLTLIHTILLYVFYNILYSAASPYLGKISDDFGRKWVLISGLLIFAFVYVGFGFATSIWEFWALFGVYGLYMAATDGVGKAFAVDLVPANLKATGVGILGTVTGFATIFASSLAGFLWDKVGPEWTFIYGAGGAVLATLIMITLPAKMETIQ